jgi:hypothetical protein
VRAGELLTVENYRLAAGYDELPTEWDDPEDTEFIVALHEYERLSVAARGDRADDPVGVSLMRINVQDARNA